MTIEQKAKRYDEALKWMRRLYPTMTGIDKEDAEHYFPELRESEDERIRKELIELIGCMHDADPRKKGWLAWLEKQGKQNKFFNVPSREVILSIWDLGNEWKELTKGGISTEYGTQLDYIQKHWQESEYYLRAKQSEQKPTDEEMKELLRTEYEKGRADAIAETQVAWSKEDKDMINHIIFALPKMAKGCIEMLPSVAEEYADRLKDLKQRITNKQ